MLRTLKTLAWKNRWLTRLATRAVDVAYLVRRASGRAGHRPAASPNGTTMFHRYMAEFSSVEGWFSEPACALWDCLLGFQAVSGVRGNFLEIGVLRGKSAALLALHARTEETCVFIDPALRLEAVRLINAIRPENNCFLRERSDQTHDSASLCTLGTTFRWIHIDGEHTARAVLTDLGLAARILAPQGIICVDDFFNPSYPQITKAVFEFAQRNDDSFLLFACGFNKGYFCRCEHALPYLRFLRDQVVNEMRRRGQNDLTLNKTTTPSEMNCFGFTQRQQGLEIKGPDWAPGRIEI